MMNKIYLLSFSLLLAFNLFSQTNPPVLTLPVSIDFGTANFTPPYTGMVAWTGSGSRPYATIGAAEASDAGTDVAGTVLFNTAPTTAGGQYGHAVSGNARLTIVTSGNATNGSTQAAMAINTTGQTNISVAYSLTLTVANLRDIGIALQYRVGNSGAFTTIAGSSFLYNSASSNGGDTDGPTDSDSYSFTLPAAAENNAEVQLRWITSRGAQAGNNSGIGLDNIVIGTLAPACAEPTTQPTNLILNATANTVTGSFDLIPVPTEIENYLVVRSLSNSLSVLPADGVNYTAGQVVGGGNGTVVSVSNNGTFTDNALSPSTAYFYFVFAMNDQNCSGGPNYFQTNPLSGGVTTSPLAACTTPGAPTSLILTPANTSVSGSFTGSAANRYLTIISTSTPLTVTPSNGTVYTVGQTIGNGTVVNYTTGTTFVATGLSTSTQYYFYLFAANTGCTGEPFYSTSLTGNSTTTNVAGGIPAGYYSSASGTCQSLKTSLRNIIASAGVISYAGLYTAYQYTDVHRNDANTATIIWDMYSDNPSGAEPYTYTYGVNECGNYNSEGDCYNREHSTPKSWFNDATPMYSDIQHLYPTDGKVNGLRSNYPYGEVTTATNTTLNGSKLGTGNNFGFTGIVFEPINAYKGDLARTSLYMATRYENEIIANNWAANSGNANAVFLSTTDQPNAAMRKLQIYDDWYLKTVFKWHNQDPVSQKEIDRNNAVYYQTAQQNRNPYIDHPEYAAMVFQCTGIVPVTIVDFTAQKNKETVLLAWYATYETSFKEYKVERSTDGITFQTVGTVTGRNLSEYNFTDNNLPKNAVLYYRLRMIDLDGKFEYSKIVSVRLNNDFSNAIVYPNPVVGKLNIKLDDALQSAGSLQIMDVAGRIVKLQSVNAGLVNIGVDVYNLSPGRYFIKIITGTQAINLSFVIIK